MAASSAQVELWVKGDPKTETLLDCTCKFGRLLAIQRKRGRDGTTERVLASDEWSGRRLIELNKTHTEKKKTQPFFFSGPFCHRVLLAAGEKQVPLTLGYVDFAAKPDW